MSNKTKKKLPEKGCREIPKEDPPIYINAIEINRLLDVCGMLRIPIK